MIVTFLVPSTPHPSGGVLGIIEFANGLARRGHEVHLVHLPFIGPRAEGTADLAWCPMEPSLIHHFVDDVEEADLPESEFSFCFDSRIPASGLPLTFFQASQILPPEIDEAILRSPGLLLCTAGWLRRFAIDSGVPAPRAFHLPYGIRHSKYQLTEPIEGRPPRVAMLYNRHPMKAPHVGIEAIDAAKALVPDLEAVIFGTEPTLDGLPAWMEYRPMPSQEELVNDLYNRSRVFVSPAIVEGFGLAAVEAMACGCALVTTASGGPEDYATDRETAFVSAPLDVEAMASSIVLACTDTSLCADVAEAGRQRSLTFDWDVSAEMLERILEGYRADPAPR